MAGNRRTRGKHRWLLTVTICAALAAAALLHRVREVPPAHAERAAAPKRQPLSSPQGARRLGRLSSRVRPAIARPDVGEAVSARELAPAFDAYKAALRERVAANGRTIPDPDAVLGLSVSEAGPARREMLARFTEGEVTRRAGVDVNEWLAGLQIQSEEPCAVIAVLQLLSNWPEAEPGSLLADVARAPANRSLYLTNFAIGVMGATGRADYEEVLRSFIDPDRDPRTITRALTAAALITGDAGLALEVIDERFPFDERLARGLPGSMLAADGPSVGNAMERLLGSIDPLRKESGLRAAALGVGMPLALPLVVEAATDPALSVDGARHAIAAIASVSSVELEPLLLGLADTSEATADVRAGALARLPAPPTSLVLEVARRGPDPILAVQMLVRSERATPGSAGPILAALAGSHTSARELVSEIASTDDPALIRAARRVFSDPRLW